jgi:hypothetical protein
LVCADPIAPAQLNRRSSRYAPLTQRKHPVKPAETMPGRIARESR